MLCGTRLIVAVLAVLIGAETALLPLAEKYEPVPPVSRTVAWAPQESSVTVVGETENAGVGVVTATELVTFTVVLEPLESTTAIAVGVLTHGPIGVTVKRPPLSPITVVLTEKAAGWLTW